MDKVIDTVKFTFFSVVMIVAAYVFVNLPRIMNPPVDAGEGGHPLNYSARRQGEVSIPPEPQVFLPPEVIRLSFWELEEITGANGVFVNPRFIPWNNGGIAVEVDGQEVRWARFVLGDEGVIYLEDEAGHRITRVGQLLKRLRPDVRRWLWLDGDTLVVDY